MATLARKTASEFVGTSFRLATVARMLSDTFAGIAPSSVPAFLVAQLAGVAVAAATTRFTFSRAG